MRIIFLDFDGVLNSHQSAHFWHYYRDNQNWKDLYVVDLEFCPIALSNMEELVRRCPDVKIVISSSWRLGCSLQDLKDFFKGHKILADAVIGRTDSFSDIRGNEIEKWLNDHPEVTNYVIIDDENDMIDTHKNNFVHVSELHGFQFGDILWAERILDRENNG